MAESYQEFSGASTGCRALRETTAGELVTQEDVLPDRQPVDQVELLIDGGYTLLQRRDRGAERCRLSLPEHLSLVDGVGAGQHLDQGGFTCPVLPEKTVHLTSPHLQIDAVQRAHARENLDDPPHLQQGDAGVVFLDLGHAVTVDTVSYVGQAK